ncbi:ATP-binding protein [Actinoplanes sp. NPDC023936]|uniref:ATP-binding protein n=1 Tax=Actinoplanes sp. NPDC023936 TaxID=3154910 RepID=UPI0033E1274C
MDQEVSDLSAPHSGFVGRQEQLLLFRRALSRSGPAPAVLFLHGPGGIGKSSLLRRFAEEARAAGYVTVSIDCGDVDGSPAGFEAMARRAVDERRSVLLVDSFERCQVLEVWLREVFLPRLPADSLVVIAGRQAPDPEWAAHPGWWNLLRVERLGPLRMADSTALLEHLAVPAARYRPVLELAGGHPLALVLTASAAASAADDDLPWQPPAEVTSRLLPQLLGTVPSARYQRALHVSAMAQVTNEALLRDVLGDDAESLFAWLRRLPFMRGTAQGIQPNDVIRETLDRHLRRRDAPAYEQLHSAVYDYFLRQLHTGPDSQVTATVGALLFLIRHNGPMSSYHTWHLDNEVQETAFRRSDTARVLHLADKAEGPDSAAVVAYWLRRQPQAFRVYRSPRSESAVAFSAWLKLRNGEGADADPVVAAAWEHATATSPVRDGEHIGLARFSVQPENYQRFSPVMDRVQWRAIAEIARSSGLALSYVVMRDNGYWDEQLSHFDMPRIDATPAVGARRYALFAHDWRAAPVAPWFGRHKRAVLTRTPEPATTHTVLSRPEFDAAVRDALRHLRHPARLDGNPLAHSKLTLDHGGNLAALMRREVDRLREGRGGDKRHRAVFEAFLRGGSTQEAAAARLGLPFSTYRRHLRQGIERLSEALWQQEIRA